MPGPLDSLFKLKLPKPPEVSPEQEQLYRANVEREQATQSPLRKAAQRVLTAPAEILSGLFHDPTQDLTAEQRNPVYAVGALGSALPFAPKGVKGLYSRVEKIAESLPESIHPNKLATILRNRASQEEVQWRGLDKLMQGAGGRQIPKQTVVEQLEKNPLDVKVITKGDPIGRGTERNPEFSSSEDATIYSNYQMPGYTPGSYRETVLQLPLRQDISRYGYIPPDSDAASGAGIFRSHHWPEPNPLAHVRFNERRLPPLTETGKAHVYTEGSNPPYGAEIDPATIDQVNTIPGFRAEKELKLSGPRGRMLENVQSDWHQRGAHQGYGNNLDPVTLRQPEVDMFTAAQQRLEEDIEAITRELRGNSQYVPDDLLMQAGDLETKAQILTDELTQIPISPNSELKRLYDSFRQTRIDYDNAHDALVRSSGERVPNAPFKDSWTELALKQQLLDVADRPEIEWLGIAPSSELRARGEVISPEFQDKQLPNTLEKLLKPFGGTIEKTDLGIKPSHVGDPTTIYPEMLSYANTALGPFGGLVQHTPDGVEELLSFVEHPTNVSDVMALKDQIVAQRPNLEAFIARLTPEMKQAIKEKGFPLLSLVALMRLMEQDSSPEAVSQAMSGLEAQ